MRNCQKFTSAAKAGDGLAVYRRHKMPAPPRSGKQHRSLKSGNVWSFFTQQSVKDVPERFDKRCRGLYHLLVLKASRSAAERTLKNKLFA